MLLKKSKSSTLKDKRILVAGGAGSIGSELVRQLAKENKIFVLDTNETATFDLTEELSQEGYWTKPRIGDIRNKETVADLFADFKPQIVFQAAAYKHVSPMEMYPEEAISTNIMGTYNLLREAKRYECLEKFVFISTDKAVSSASVMGATKRVGEIMVKNQGGIAVRFGNVMGSRGSVLPIWQRQMDQGKPLTITDKRMTRYMMTIPEAVSLVIKAAEVGNGGEIFCLEMGQPVNIHNLALDILGKSGSNVGIKEIGLRPGETLEERLWLAEEKPEKIGDFWVIK
jgi:FlaA1/EpsC-like NDP-sugar epimerase